MKRRFVVLVVAALACVGASAAFADPAQQSNGNGNGNGNTPVVQSYTYPQAPCSTC